MERIKPGKSNITEIIRHLFTDFKHRDDYLIFHCAIGELILENNIRTLCFFKDYFNPRYHHLLRLGYFSGFEEKLNQKIYE